MRPYSPRRARSVRAAHAYVRSVLASVKGPVVLVGHSYGGAVISEAATGEPHVKAQFPGSTLGENLNPVSFPIAAGALEKKATGAAWKTIPSWSLIGGFHRRSPVTLPRSYVELTSVTPLRGEVWRAPLPTGPGTGTSNCSTSHPERIKTRKRCL
ncbi:alpha/beta fold hydrolase [Streptomyces sp. NRRL WC-3725]|uniref:alpha/beta fold hydrolase n=1 Tax=Streptomyces sp. NRRL WC-3725 TaxID=1463933 RepID=UPI00099DBF83